MTGLGAQCDCELKNCPSILYDTSKSKIKTFQSLCKYYHFSKYRRVSKSHMHVYEKVISEYS